MTPESHIAALDRSIADNTKLVELAKALERLETNRDFKKIIGEGYFNAEAVRLVHAKSDPAMQTPEKQASLLKDMDGIGSLSEYFRTIRTQAAMASNGIADAEEQRLEILGGE